MKEIKITDNVVIYNDISGYLSKYQPRWHKKVYMMWRIMWKRVYGDIHWFGALIDPSFKYLSNYAKWVESQPNFEEFCATCNKVRWSIDKDSKCLGNRNYYPEYMTLMTQSENCIERNNRNGNPSLKHMKPVIGIPLDRAKKIILTIGCNDVSKYGFNSCNVSSCLANRLKTHKRYKWYYVNYKHSLRLRRVQSTFYFSFIKKIYYGS